MSWLLSPIGSIASLEVVADVTLSAIGAGELLQWNGSAWINQTLAEIGVGTGDAVKANNETITGDWTFPATGFTVGATALTETKVGQWDTAYGWGDWSGQGFLTSVAISDLDNGTDGELITWSAAGVATTVPVGTSTHVLTSNGVGAAPTFQAAAGGGAASVTKHKTADETVTSSTTYQADDHLDGFAMDADSYYKIEGCLHLTGHASGDYKSYFLFSNAVQLLNYQFHNVHSNAGHYVDAGGVGATSIVLSVNTTVLHSVAIIGFIKSNAVTGGTFGLQWAQNASFATGTTLHEGSWITITKIA